MSENEQLIPLSDDLAVRKKQLARLSLIFKWFHGSRMRINHRCPFCYDTVKRNPENYGLLECEICLCPHEICADESDEGLIAELEDCENVRDLPRDQLNKMIALFEQTAEGKLWRRTRRFTR